MPKVRRLKPRRTWTNRLAWAVWKQRQNNKLRAASDTICRWFSNFNGVDSYAEFVNDIALVGDFEFSVTIPKINTDAGFNFRMIFGNDISSDTFIGYQEAAGGRFLVRTDGQASTSTYMFNSFTGGVLKGVSSAGNLELFIDEVSIGSEIFLGTLTINLVGAYNSGFFMSGQIANILFWINGDSTTGTQIVNMLMDEQGSGVIEYNNTVTGLTGATGYNITTEQDPDCLTNNVTYQGDNVTYEGDQVVY